MDKIKQVLKELGLEDDKIKQFIDDAIKDKFVPKHRFDEVNEKNKQLTEDVSNRDKQIKDLSKFEGDNKALKEKIETLEKDNQEKDEANAKAIRELKIDNAVTYALNGKVQEGYADLVTGLIDKSLIVLKDDGSVSGLEEQINKIKESKALLFVDENTEDNTKQTPGWSIKGKDPKDGQHQTKQTVSENFVQSLLDDNKDLSEATKTATDYYFGTK